MQTQEPDSQYYRVFYYKAILTNKSQLIETKHGAVCFFLSIFGSNQKNITMNLKSTIKTGIFIAACCFGLDAGAQVLPKNFGQHLPYEPCGTTKYEKLLQQKDPKRANAARFEQWLAPKVAETKAKRMQKDGNDVIVIPVVFHIIHNGDAIGENENIAAEQIESQITVLNQDFRRMAGTNGYNEHPDGADIEIEFCLAKQDENGLYTTGIERYNLGNDIGFDMFEVEELKALTQWDPEKYLNIWVCNQIFGLGGYAQFPVESGLEGLDVGSPTAAETDGVALVYNCVGSAEIYPEGEYMPGNDLGRIASHEIGHFFGLRHIWGDGTDCTGTDYCDDTPFAASANMDCPEGTDSCTEDEGNDMIENHMDYTNDSCKNIFTQDQKDRMLTVLANSPRRASLVTSPGCTPGSTYDLDGALRIQGTQAGEGCSTSLEPEIVFTNEGDSTITSATITYQIDDEAVQTIEWEGSLESGEEDTIELGEMDFEPGTHQIIAEIIDVNDSDDENDTNNEVVQEINIIGTYNTTQVTINIMTDNFGDEVLWIFGNEASEEPLATNINQSNPMLSDFPPSNALFTTTVDIEESGCYIFLIIDLMGDGICCANGNGYYSVETADGTVIAEGGNYTSQDMKWFSLETTAGTNDVNAFGAVKLYPNPANNLLNIAMDAANMPESYTVYNSLGQVMGSGVITTVTQTLNIAAYAEGVYFVKLEKGHSTQTMQFIKY